MFVWGGQKGRFSKFLMYYMHKILQSLAVIFFLVLFIEPFSKFAFAEDAIFPNAIDGFWYTEGHEGGIELYQCGDKTCGRFYWLNPKGPDNITNDVHNSDPAKRDRPLCMMQFMGNFTSDKVGHYTDGWIYSPRQGTTFSAEMTLIDQTTLHLRGYLLSPVLGETQVWKRVDSLPSCKSGS